MPATPFEAILARAQVDDVESVLATVDVVSKRLETPIVLFDAAAILNRRHLESAVFHAVRAEAEGRATAKTPAAEILLYAAGEHQVARAIDRCGIRPGLTRIIVLATGPKAAAAIWGALDKLGWSKDPTGIATNPAALERHRIQEGPEADAEKRILERVALVDLRR